MLGITLNLLDGFIQTDVDPLALATHIVLLY